VEDLLPRLQPLKVAENVLHSALVVNEHQRRQKEFTLSPALVTLPVSSSYDEGQQQLNYSSLASQKRLMIVIKFVTPPQQQL